MKKRILSIFLAVLLFCGIVFSPGAALPVRASSVAFAPEASLEIMEILYTLLINGMIASGASDVGSLDYDSAMGLFDSFMDSACRSAGLPGTELELDADAVYMVLDSGTVVTWGDIAQSWTDGTGALQLPTEEQWQAFSVVKGGAGSPGGPGGNKDFSKVEAIRIGTSFMTAMGAWIYDLASGNITNVDSGAIFYPDGTPFSGYNVDAEGNYHYNSYSYSYDTGRSVWCNCVAHTCLVEIQACTRSIPYFAVYNSSGSYAIHAFNPDKNEIVNSYVYLHSYVTKYQEDGSLCPYPNNGTSNPYGVTVYNVKPVEAAAIGLPVFASDEAALAFFQQQDASGLLNGKAYDFPLLATMLAGVFAPLTGFYFDPAALPGISQALDTAVAPLPLPDADPAANTEAYKEAVTEAVAVSVPEALPDPSPEPAPDPDTGEMEKYKTDLRMVFPFCLPFDFIHFLEVMDADPVAPHFEFPFVVPALGIDMTVDIDLSFMDGAVEVFRVGELVSFILLLIAVTPKLIRW